VRLHEVLAGVDVVEREGSADPDVVAVTHDSRSVLPGTLFCCLPGTHVDGHDFAAAAERSGAVGLLVERFVPDVGDAPQVRVASVRPAMAIAAANLFGHPSRSLRVVGVTGTNGKTTTTYLLDAIFEAHGWPSGVIGTLGGVRTTPEAPELQALLAGSRDKGRRAVAMEVSSHALAQHRVDAVHFAVAAFTNLSQDHLDFHGDMDAYFEAKARLFESGRAEVGVINADDPYGRRLLDVAGIRTRPYSLADAAGLELDRLGSRFTWQGQPVSLRLGGRFNVANALCAAACAAELGIPAADVAAGLSSVARVPGRFEAVDAGQPFALVVDYAHTPEGLEQVLGAARELVGDGGHVIVVFGAGGERDRGKRPLMGAAATRLADVAVLTSDNPRSEDPMAIIEQVRSGAVAGAELIIEPDRAAAIALAVERARQGDVVVVAGKGHETGQVIGEQTIPFDDREVARGFVTAAPGSVSPGVRPPYVTGQRTDGEGEGRE
jgi:UDP-N-acetylmuramoyl-L-alanyl-D-glutamate--2,6-diaminopimelate ligase